MSEKMAAGNGHVDMFSLDSLLGIVVPFEFTFEGSKLKGQWYKYKTTTPAYVRSVMVNVRALREEILSLTDKVAAASNTDPELPTLLQHRDELEDQLQRTPYDWMAAAITEWNAVGHDKGVLPITKETLDSWPLLFLSKLNQFFATERTQENPTLPIS